MSLNKIIWLVAIILLCALGIIFFSTSAASKTYSYTIINTYPHDEQAFTQGLIYHQGQLYESTGLRGKSSLRRVELTTGKVLQIHHLPPPYFAEGLTLWDDQLIQLTWQEYTGFVYDSDSFEILQRFNYDTEGWGLTNDDQYLIMSDGSELLYYLDPDTFAVVKTLQVRDGNLTITRLNELEYINGEIWANIWGSNCLARISPQTGKVKAWVNLQGLRPTSLVANPQAVLNGIAYAPESDRLFVTGKLWPSLFEIKLTSSLEEQICF